MSVSDDGGGGLSPQMRRALDAEIDPGERIAWVGRPSVECVRKRVLLLFRLNGVGLAAFAILFVVLGVSLARDCLTVIDNPHATPGLIAGSVAGVAVIFLVALGVLWLAYSVAVSQVRKVTRQAELTAYALTGTRLIKLSCLDGREPIVESYEPSHPLNIARRPYRCGATDVMVSPRMITDASGAKARSGVFTFEAVVGARDVDRLIRAAFDPQRVTT